MQKFLSTRFSIVSRSAPKGKCSSAVDASGYIEREERDSEYDGHHYNPDAKEDLVHKEVTKYSASFFPYEKNGYNPEAYSENVIIYTPPDN